MGFIGNQAAMMVYEIDLTGMSLDELRNRLRLHGFSGAAHTDGVKLVYGWCNFNEMSQPFNDIINLDRYYFWSFRYDTRKANAARVKVELDKAITDAISKGANYSIKEMREQIALRELMAAPWIPHIVDLCYDVHKKRLFISTLNNVTLDQIDKLIAHTFGEDLFNIPGPTCDPYRMSDAIAASLDGDDSALQEMTGITDISCDIAGTAKFRKGQTNSTVTTVASEEASLIAAQNTFQIVRASMVISSAEEDGDTKFDMDAYGRICRVVFPKVSKKDKEDDLEGVLYINAELLSDLSDIAYHAFGGGEDAMELRAKEIKEIGETRRNRLAEEKEIEQSAKALMENLESAGVTMAIEEKRE